jgi:5,10-methylenetetrahydromethanopterin reductase
MSLERQQCSPLPEALLDLGVTSSAPMSLILQLARLANQSNVYGIWLGEDIDRGRDVFVQAEVAMRSASNKRIGIGVTSPLVHNISTIARAGATLREIDSERFRLGLGVGRLQDLARLRIEVRKPYKILDETVDVLRRIWAGDTLSVKIGNLKLRKYLARHRTGFVIPLYLGVRGLRLLTLAGRVADGVILSGPRPYLKRAIEVVYSQAGQRKLNQRPRIVFWLPTLVVREKADRELARTVAANIIAHTPISVCERAGISDAIVLTIQTAARERGYAAASSYVNDELLNAFTISGDPRQICDTFLCLAKLGADEIVLGPPYGHDILDSIRGIIRMWERE